MKVKGRISEVFAMTEGVSQRTGNRWQRQDFIIEYFEDENAQYADSVVLSVMNDKIAEYELKENDMVTAEFALHARTYNGRAYLETRLLWLKKDAAAATEQADAKEADPVDWNNIA